MERTQKDTDSMSHMKGDRKTSEKPNRLGGKHKQIPENKQKFLFPLSAVLRKHTRDDHNRQRIIFRKQEIIVKNNIIPTFKNQNKDLRFFTWREEPTNKPNQLHPQSSICWNTFKTTKPITARWTQHTPLAVFFLS